MLGAVEPALLITAISSFLQPTVAYNVVPASSVVKTTSISKNGEQVNAFHNREKGKKFFKKIPHIPFSIRVLLEVQFSLC